MPLFDGVVEIGRSSTCDLVLDEPGVPERALLAWREGSQLVVQELGSDRRQVRAKPDRTLQIGLLSLKAQPAPTDVHTDAIRRPKGDRLSLSSGPPGAERRYDLGVAPLVVGAALDCDIVLKDAAVSRRHCRLEPTSRGVVLRDLASRNGTWLDGHRVWRAELRAGATLRLGHTELRIVHTDGSDGPDTDLVAESEAMLKVVEQVDRLAPLPWPVLIVGESGVGKEEVAKRLHRGGEFVALNAGGLSPALVESELFGHERGAFTGASRRHRGAFEQADGGTLFLDEIGELPLELQARLLRVLECWQIRRVGGDRPIDVRLRLISATHRKLSGMVGVGTFREDLFYRISRLVIEVPPLRVRRADIAPLALRFLRLVEPEVGLREIEPAAMALLREHEWPGNVRELRNVMTAAAVACRGTNIDRLTIARALGSLSMSHPSSPTALREAVVAHGGNVTAAARMLGLPRSTLRDRLARAKRSARAKTSR